jgi:hypothetical protein
MSLNVSRLIVPLGCWSVAFQIFDHTEMCEHKMLCLPQIYLLQRYYWCCKKRVLVRQWRKRRFTSGVSVSMMGTNRLDHTARQRTWISIVRGHKVSFQVQCDRSEASVIFRGLVIARLFPVFAIKNCSEETKIHEDRRRLCKNDESTEKWFPEMFPKALWTLEKVR